MNHSASRWSGAILSSIGVRGLFKQGDTLHVVGDENGGVRITPFDPHFEDALNAFERTRRKHRNALNELAKQSSDEL